MEAFLLNLQIFQDRFSADLWTAASKSLWNNRNIGVHTFLLLRKYYTEELFNHIWACI